MSSTILQARFAQYEGDFLPLHLEGTEEVNRPYRFTLHLSVPRAEVDAFRTSAFEHRASVTLRVSDRHWHGVVDAVTVGAGLAQDRVKVAIRLVPRFEWLRHKRQSRIFQELTTREIAERVLRENGVEAVFDLEKELPRRVYACQYAESDLRFLTRLFAEDGLFYRFDHSGPREERLMVADTSRAYRPIAGDPNLVIAPPAPDSGMHLEEHHVIELGCRTRVQTRSAIRRAHDMERPSLDLRDAAVGDAMPENISSAEAMHKELLRGGLAHEDHLGVREAHGGLRAGAARYLEGLRAGALAARGRSVCVRLSPGHTFRVEGHPSDLGDLELVVRRVHHRIRGEAQAGGRATYENQFEAVPRDVPLRPAPGRGRTKATMETAMVVGPAGQEVHTDGLGRVRVQFHWDLDGRRDERSSCWLRVSQAWAGAGFGAQFLPRVGMEVLVSFVGGDPDRPLVTGALHNGAAAPPLHFPRESHTSGIRTRSTPGGAGGHELLFGDEAGGEYVSLRSERTLAIGAGANGQLTTGADLRVAVAGKRTDETGGDAQQRVAGAFTSSVAGACSSDIAGNATCAIGGDRKTRVVGRDELEVEGQQYEVVNGSRSVTVGADRRTPAHDVLMVSGMLHMSSGELLTLASSKAIRLQCGKSSLVIHPDKITLESAKIEALGLDQIALTQGEDAAAALTLAKTASLRGEQIGIVSPAGGRLELAERAELRAAEITMKGTKPSASKPVARSTERATGKILVRKDWFPPDVTTVVVTIAMPDGETIERSCAPGGTIEVDGFKGDPFRVVAMRVEETDVDFHHVVPASGA